MKNRKLFAFLCLCAAFLMTMTACGGEIALRGEQELGADPKAPGETDITPQETWDKQEEVLTVYDPSQGGTVQDNTPQPTDAHITVPEEEITTPGQMEAFEFQSVRVQDVSGDKMKYLMAKYLPLGNSDAGLSMVHITKTDSLEKFLQEVDSAVFREKCAIYDEDFFSQYDLIVIPRITNSGSVRHSAELVKGDGELAVSVSVSVPEYATADMANWLLVVPVAKADTQGVTIRAGMDIAADLPMPTIGWGKQG